MEAPRVDILPRLGSRFVLRRLAADDVAAFQAYRHDPELARYQGWSPMSDEEARAFLVAMTGAALLDPGSWTQIGIAEPASRHLIGDIGVCLAPDGRCAEIGFTLARHAQGRGVATEAVRAAIGLIFDSSGTVDRVIAVTDARNHASVRLLERVGMQRSQTRDAVFRGEPCVEHVYAVARGDGRPTARGNPSPSPRLER